MSDRVEQLRERLAPLLLVVSGPLRKDLDDLLDLAELGERARSQAIETPAAAPTSLHREPLAEQSSPDAAPSAASDPPAPGRSLRHLLAEILGRSGAPMRVRDLTEAALARGWTSTSASPRNVVAACLNGKEEFVQLAPGEYALRSRRVPEAERAAAQAPVPPRAAPITSDAPPPITPDAAAPEVLAPATGDSSARKSLRALLREVLAERRAPMRAGEIVEVLVARGWTTTSPRPRDVVAAVLTGKPEFVAVERGTYALRDAPLPVPTSEATAEIEPGSSSPAAATSDAQTTLGAVVALAAAPDDGPARDHGAPRPSAREAPGLPPGVLRRAPPTEPGGIAEPAAPPRASARPQPAEAPPVYSAAVAEIGQELEFLLRHVSDARADTAVLAPALLRLQITAWISRARALNDRARNHPEIVRATGRVAAELGDLCKRWWPGSVEAMKLDTQPYQALRPFTSGADEPTLTWLEVANRLDAQMAAAWAETEFDDGWRDTRWLCDDERFVADRLAEAEALLARLGTPITDPPPKRPSDINLTVADVQQIVFAARGVRWVRGVVTEGLRWGLIMGRLRWIAATHPAAARSNLSPLLAAEYQPLGSGWGLDEIRRREAKEQLLRELPQVPDADLPRWLARAIDVFDNPELARVLADRISEIANIDPNALGSRRARGRVRKLAAMMGVSLAEAAAANGAAAVSVEADPEPTTSEAAGDSFSSIRTSLLARIGGNRGLFISNREDVPLRDRLSALFGLELEWCVASPRRMDAAADAIRRGRYDVVLSATGFQDHSMDIAFARAAREASTLYVRVNRGRPAACARAIARELGLQATG